MILRPASKEELAQALRAANDASTKIERVDLTALGRIRKHTPEDMTVTVEAGITLAQLQSALGQRGQWLPIDPPNPDRLTMGAVLANNVSGPRRFGFGTIREHLIGLEVILADGRLIHSGGKVVKNVAGYDLMKLFIGGRDSLGVIVEATFKLLPLPESESLVQRRCESLDEAQKLVEAVQESELTPIVFDLCRGESYRVVLAFAGTREDVAWQLQKAAALGIQEPAGLDYEASFWKAEAAQPHRQSVLPSRLIETIRLLGDVPFVARAGNGVVYYRGETPAPKATPALDLMRRVKDAFDPKRILPEMPL